MLHVSSERENPDDSRNGKRDFDYQIVGNSAKEFCCEILNYKSNVLICFCFFLFKKIIQAHDIGIFDNDRY